MSKIGRICKDFIYTENQSCVSDIIEKLLLFFCEISENDCFYVTLYSFNSQDNDNENKTENNDETNDKDNNKIYVNKVNIYYNYNKKQYQT